MNPVDWNLAACIDALAAPDAWNYDALRWARDHWDEAGPVLRERLSAYVERRDRSERAETILGAALYLFMDRKDAAVFPHLVRLGREGDELDHLLGGGTDEIGPALFIATFDGDIDRLWSVAEAAHGDAAVRGAALRAYVWLTLAGRQPMEDAKERLRGAFRTFEPREPGRLWTDLAYACADLGFADLWPLAKAACKEGLIPARFVRMRDLEEDFQSIKQHFAQEKGHFLRNYGPPDDAIAEMERLEAEAKALGLDQAEDEEAGAEEESGDDAPPDDGVPAENPFRDVGRNDPCPCGSGKKFKKCCLAA